MEPITRRGRHVLLLSATPLEDDAHGFFRLLQLLRHFYADVRQHQRRRGDAGRDRAVEQRGLAVDRGGRVADPAVNDPDTVALRELNTTLLQDERIDLSLLPVGDGLLAATWRG